MNKDTLGARFDERFTHPDGRIDEYSKDVKDHFKRELERLAVEVEKKIDERTDYDLQTNKAVAVMNNSYREVAALIRSSAEELV